MSLLDRFDALFRPYILCLWCGHLATWAWTRWWHQTFCLPHLSDNDWAFQDRLHEAAPEQPQWRRPKARKPRKAA